MIYNFTPKLTYMLTTHHYSLVLDKQNCPLGLPWHAQSLHYLYLRQQETTVSDLKTAALNSYYSLYIGCLSWQWQKMHIANQSTQFPNALLVVLQKQELKLITFHKSLQYKDA
jgi:hypothetical protein